tara:strand:- start:7009 stop:8121 length:1113 start_codon:yes stop_codon:yes gene_type:complete
MKILFVLSHPGHYYLFKNLAIQLNNKGHNTFYAIRGKDILEKILISEKVKYKKLCNEFYRGNNKFTILGGAISEMLLQDFKLLFYSKEIKPDLLIGTDISISHIGKLMKVPSLIFNEDDYEINKLFCKATYPFAKYIVAPVNCSVGKYTNKKISYDGYQKIAYLHPKFFKISRNILTKLKLNNKPYYFIRIVNLKAIHDIESQHKGLSLEILKKIISKLEKTGKVFINSEGEIYPELKKYYLKIEVNEIHQVLANASMFIGDSQTMSAEAGLLGTPFIRFNDFVGKINYLNDMENKYKLGFGIKTNEVDKLFETIDFIINNNLKNDHFKKSLKLFDEKVNVTDFWTWLVDEYPNSINIIKKDPNYQYNFR